MSEDNSSDKREKLKEILPLAWNSYEHMYNVRDTGTRNMINFLLIVATFLPLLCIGLANNFDNNLFLIPIIFQISALLILFRSFFNRSQISWLEIKETLNNLDNNKFEESLFTILKTCESETWTTLKYNNDIIKKALYVLLFSLYSLLIAVIFFIFAKDMTLFFCLVLGISFPFGWLFIFYYKGPESRFDKNHNRNIEIMEQWLKKD